MSVEPDKSLGLTKADVLIKYQVAGTIFPLRFFVEEIALIQR